MRAHVLAIAVLLTATTPPIVNAQSIVFNNCNDLPTCLPLNNCSAAPIAANMSASSSCSNPSFNFLHTIDFGNNGSPDIQASGNTFSHNFPLGQSKITWRAANSCGQVATCQQIVTVQDCAPPNMICRNGITQSLDNNCSMTINAQQFILNISDNCTPVAQLQYGLRKAGTGTGFPTKDTIQYATCDQGTNIVEVWVRDGNGLVNQCSNYVLVQDNSNQCPCIQDTDIQVKGCARTAQNTKLNSYRTNAYFSGTANGQPFSTNQLKNQTDSCFTLNLNDLPINLSGNLSIRLTREDNITNGVTAYDLILISRHILSLEPFTSFYQALAADANGSKTVTTLDIVDIRKTILGVTDTFSGAPKWRFIRPVTDPSDILASFAEMKDTALITYQNVSGITPAVSGLSWVGVKIGDVENLTSFNAGNEERERPELTLTAPNHWLEAGKTIELPIQLIENTSLAAWQLQLETKLNHAKIVGVKGLPNDAFTLKNNQLKILWLHDNPGMVKDYKANDTLFTVLLSTDQASWTSDLLQLNNKSFTAEAVFSNTSTQNISLLFQNNGIRSSAQIFKPYPNPSSSHIQFPMGVDYPTDLLLEIFDITGKQIFQKFIPANSETSTIFIEDSTFPQKGCYSYRISTNSTLVSGQLIRI